VESWAWAVASGFGRAAGVDGPDTVMLVASRERTSAAGTVADPPALPRGRRPPCHVGAVGALRTGGLPQGWYSMCQYSGYAAPWRALAGASQPKDGPFARSHSYRRVPKP
jgi:hypothetical protein